MHFFIMFLRGFPICDPTRGSQKTLGANLLPRTGGFRLTDRRGHSAAREGFDQISFDSVNFARVAFPWTRPGHPRLCQALTRAHLIGRERLGREARHHDRGWARTPCRLAITVAGVRLDQGTALRSGRGIASNARSFAPG